MKSKGQALVEVVILTPMLLAMIFFLGFAIFELLSRVMLSQLADKAVICETSNPRVSCQHQFQTQLQKFSQQLRLKTYDLKKSSDRYRLKIEVAFPLKRQLRLEKEMSWSDRGPS